MKSRIIITLITNYNNNTLIYFNKYKSMNTNNFKSYDYISEGQY